MLFRFLVEYIKFIIYLMLGHSKSVSGHPPAWYFEKPIRTVMMFTVNDDVNWVYVIPSWAHCCMHLSYVHLHVTLLTGSTWWNESVLILKDDTSWLRCGTSENTQDDLSLEDSKLPSGGYFRWWILQWNYPTNHRLATRAEAKIHPLQKSSWNE